MAHESPPTEFVSVHQRCSWAGSSSGIHRFRRREYLLHKCGDVLHGGRKMKSRSLSIQGDRIVFWWKVPWPHSLHLKMSVRRLPVNAQEPDAALLICCEHELRDFVRNHVRFDQCCAWCFEHMFWFSPSMKALLPALIFQQLARIWSAAVVRTFHGMAAISLVGENR